MLVHLHPSSAAKFSQVTTSTQVGVKSATASPKIKIKQMSDQ